MRSAAQVHKMGHLFSTNNTSVNIPRLWRMHTGVSLVAVERSTFFPFHVISAFVNVCSGLLLLLLLFFVCNGVAQEPFWSNTTCLLLLPLHRRVKMMKIAFRIFNDHGHIPTIGQVARCSTYPSWCFMTIHLHNAAVYAYIRDLVPHSRGI